MDTKIESIQVFEGTDWIPEEIKEMLRLKDLEINELKAALERGKATNDQLLSHTRRLEIKLKQLEDFIGDSIPEKFYPDLP